MQQNTQAVWKRLLFREYFLWMLCHPLFVCLYAVTWFHLYSLCQFGRVKKNLPILAFCLLFFLICLVFFFIKKRQYANASTPLLFRNAAIEDGRLVCSVNDFTQHLPIKMVSHYRLTRKHLMVFSKDSKFIYAEVAPEHRAFLRLKLSSLILLRHFTWLLPTLCLLLLITAAGSLKVVKSAIPYEGKLSWFLSRLKSDRTVLFTHNNLFEDGIDGMFADIREKVRLPETLMLQTSFNLHAAEDGTILSVNTMLCGYGEDGSPVSSYLIQYDADSSDHITISVSDSVLPPFDEDLDVAPLTSALRVIPISHVISPWNQEEFGILYYGTRTWYPGDNHIKYINSRKEIIDASETALTAYEGYSISVFCPDDTDILPYRYLFLQ